MDPTSDAPFGITEIFARLPHRQPLLLVDRVEELKSGERLLAIKNVTINEDFFRGHFPGNPIFPGVLIVEALAQAAGLLISASVDAPGRLLPYLAGLDGVKFRRPVVPGDRLALEVEVLQRRSHFWRFKGQAMVEGARAAEAELLLSVRDTTREER